MTDALTGTTLGAYEVRGLLGKGGMGSVYRGYDPALDREVAIKVISGAALLPDAVERFRREARLAAALRHPNIVHVYAFGEAAGRLYMVQELLPGPSLAAQIARLRKPLAPARVRAIVGQLASALDYAHGQGVVHRDVKPANALYNAGGGLVLTDFGLAREGDQGHATTGAGVVMGTPAYVAPEQAVGSRGVTRAADIYALGVVLFELLVGRPPFTADTSMGVVLKHLYDEPPAPSALRPDLPPAVDAVVLRALRKEAAARFPTAGALAAALDEAWPAESRRAAPREAPTRATPPPKQEPPPAKQASAPRAATPPKQEPPPAKQASAPRAATPPKQESPPAKQASAPRAATPPKQEPPPAKQASAPRVAPPPAKTPRPKAADRPRPPAEAPATTPAPAPLPARRGPSRLLVGLVTACLVGALLLGGFGVDAATLARGWAELLGMLGQ